MLWAHDFLGKVTIACVILHEKQYIALVYY